MNDLLVDLTVTPQPFVHMCVRRQHPIFYRFRYACACGWRSEWFDRTDFTEFGMADSGDFLLDHPHMTVTVSRTDLSPVPHPSNGLPL